jgi:hypothetical protein
MMLFAWVLQKISSPARTAEPASLALLGWGDLKDLPSPLVQQKHMYKQAILDTEWSLYKVNMS